MTRVLAKRDVTDGVEAAVDRKCGRISVIVEIDASACMLSSERGTDAEKNVGWQKDRIYMYSRLDSSSWIVGAQ